MEAGRDPHSGVPSFGLVVPDILYVQRTVQRNATWVSNGFHCIVPGFTATGLHCIAFRRRYTATRVSTSFRWNISGSSTSGVNCNMPEGRYTPALASANSHGGMLGSTHLPHPLHHLVQQCAVLRI